MGTAGGVIAATVARRTAAKNYLNACLIRRKVLEHLGYAFVEILSFFSALLESTLSCSPANHSFSSRRIGPMTNVPSW